MSEEKKEEDRFEETGVLVPIRSCDDAIFFSQSQASGNYMGRKFFVDSSIAGGSIIVRIKGDGGDKQFIVHVQEVVEKAFEAFDREKK